MDLDAENMLTETIDEYLSGNAERDQVDEARDAASSPYANVDPDYTLLSES